MKNATKTLLTLTLSLVLVLSLACIAWAATPATSVKIGGVELYSSTLPTYYKNDGTAGSEESYNAKLWVDAENNNALTLTLHNATIDIRNDHGIYANSDLTIVLVGENTITAANGNGIRVPDDTTTLTIKGDGILNARSNEASTSGIYACNLTIFGGTVNAASQWGDGIKADTTLTITGGTVNASGNAYGIYATEAISITGGTVTATGFDAIAVSEHNANGTVTISGDNTKVTANGVNNGIYAKGPVAISSGEVTATATGEGSCGIYGGNNVTIDGGIVTANGSTNGIHAYDSNESDRIDTGNITISGGTVNATGVVMGIHADSNGTIDGGTVTISGGTVNATGNDGLYANKISISGGTVTATGSNKYGIFALKPTGNGGKIEISNGTVTATGGMGGIGANIDVAISGGTVIAKGTNPTDSVGIYAGNKATIKGGTVTIDAATTAISCTTLNMGSGNWYKWKADSNSIQTSSDTNHLSTETLAGVKKLVIAKEISDPPPPPIHYPPTVTPTTPDEGDKVTAAETLDGGIALSVAMTILTATGSAWLAKKKD